MAVRQIEPTRATPRRPPCAGPPASDRLPRAPPERSAQEGKELADQYATMRSRKLATRKSAICRLRPS
jgi:hypothetical protein